MRLLAVARTKPEAEITRLEEKNLNHLLKIRLPLPLTTKLEQKNHNPNHPQTTRQAQEATKLAVKNNLQSLSFHHQMRQEEEPLSPQIIRQVEEVEE